MFDRFVSFFKKIRARSAPVIPTLGIAWYREEQWPLLKQVSVDRDRLETSHEQWLKVAQAQIDQLSSQGKRIEKVVVDVVDLAAWCREMGREVDSAGRSAYVVYRLHSQIPSLIPPPARFKQTRGF